MSAVIIDFEGFQLPSGGYIVKELAFQAVNSNSFVGNFHFLPPCSFEELTHHQKFQYKWVTKHIHLIEWDEGELPYHQLHTIVNFLSNIFSQIYVKGLEKKRFIEFLIGRFCKNLEDVGCPKIDQLGINLNSCSMHTSNFKRCALNKVKAFARFLENDK